MMCSSCDYKGKQLCRERPNKCPKCGKVALVREENRYFIAKMEKGTLKPIMTDNPTTDRDYDNILDAVRRVMKRFPGRLFTWKRHLYGVEITRIE